MEVENSVLRNQQLAANLDVKVYVALILAFHIFILTSVSALAS